MRAPTASATIIQWRDPHTGLSLALVTKQDGYLESDNHVVAWAMTTSCSSRSQTMPTPKFEVKMADLPIMPDHYKLVMPRRALRASGCTVITRDLGRDDISIINASNAGREGELIFAWLSRRSNARSSCSGYVGIIDEPARSSRRSGRCSPATSSTRSRRRRARAPRPTGSSA